jgi:hypothetical protein
MPWRSSGTIALGKIKRREKERTQSHAYKQKKVGMGYCWLDGLASLHERGALVFFLRTSLLFHHCRTRTSRFSAVWREEENKKAAFKR